jgi:predicted phosphodiesterase
MRIGLISDLHWMREPPSSAAAWHGGGDFGGVPERLARALGHFAANDVDRIVLAGDLAHHGDLESLVEVLQALREASAPVLVVAGNHDITDDPERLTRALGMAEAPTVSLATAEASEHDGVQVAGVHVGESDAWFAARLRSVPPAGAWGSRPLLLISHYPVLSLASEISARGLPYPGDLLDREELAERLLGHPAPVLVMGGHIHARACATRGPVLQLSCGALVEPPYECALVDLDLSDGGVMTVRRQCLRLLGQAGPNEPVFSPEQEAWRFEGGRWAENVPTESTEPVGLR